MKKKKKEEEAIQITSTDFHRGNCRNFSFSTNIWVYDLRWLDRVFSEATPPKCEHFDLCCYKSLSITTKLIIKPDGYCPPKKPHRSTLLTRYGLYDKHWRSLVLSLTSTTMHVTLAIASVHPSIRDFTQKRLLFSFSVAFPFVVEWYGVTILHTKVETIIEDLLQVTMLRR